MPSTYSSCEVTLEFADADYLFRLPLKRIAELEEKCGAPVGTIWKRVCMTGDYFAADVVETVRLGLIGGGMEPQDARKLIERYCDTWPLQVWHVFAVAVLGACIEGYDAPDTEDPGQKKPEAAGSTSTSPPATPSGSRRASRQKKSPT